MELTKKQWRKARIKELEKTLSDTSACLIHRYHFDTRSIDKVSQNKLTGSAAILTISIYKGDVVVGPVAIKDGLSDATIAAIKADLLRSYNLAIEFKP